MESNAYILARTMNDYARLLVDLQKADFHFLRVLKGDVRVAVPFLRFEEFSNLVQPHLNAPYNYVDIKYPEENKLMIIFGAKRFVITNLEENEAAKKWAIDMGLSAKEADWTHWFLGRS